MTLNQELIYPQKSHKICKQRIKLKRIKLVQFSRFWAMVNQGETWGVRMKIPKINPCMHTKKNSAIETLNNIVILHSAACDIWQLKTSLTNIKSWLARANSKHQLSRIWWKGSANQHPTKEKGNHGRTKGNQSCDLLQNLG